MEAHIYGSSSWETVVYYDTSFNNGTSSITISSFQIRKGSSTTQASTSYGKAITFNVAGTSFSTTQSYNVPSGGGWSAVYYVSQTITGLTPGSSQSFSITAGPWSNIVGSGSGSVAGYPTYTVSYNANGGSGAPGAQTKTWGTTLYLSSTVPTRTNYQFLGWSTSSTATSATYSAGGAYTSNSGATLYAVWKILRPTFTQNPTLTVYETSIAFSAMKTDIASTFKYSINNGSTWVNINTSATTTSSSGTISSLSPGTSYTIIFRATANNLTTDYTITKATYSYPYIKNFTAGTVIAGNNRTIEFYNPLKRSLTITAKTNNLTVLDAASKTTTAESLALNINAAATSTALGANTSSGTVTYTMTYSSNTSSAQEAIQITATAGAPSVNSSKINSFITYVDNNSTSTAVTTANSVLLQGYSKIKITPSNTAANDPFTPLSPATIASYTIKINNGTAVSMTKGTAYYQGTNNTVVTAVGDSVAIPSTTNSISITVIATDTRGFSNEATRTITVTPYTKPTVAIQSVVRADGYGTDVALSSTWGWCAAFNSTAQSNGKVWLWYKTAGSSGDGTKYATAITTNPQTIPSIFSSNQAYLVRLQAVDALSQTTYTDWATIPLGNPIFFIDEYQNGVGINCYPDGEGAYIGGNRVVTITKGTGNPSGGSDGDIYIKYTA